MQETPQQYIQRILSNVEGKEPLAIQKETVKKIEKLVKTLSKKQLTTRPAPEKWSIAEILAHLADVELVAGWRMRLILSNNGAPIHAFDQDVWAQTFNYATRDPKSSLETLRVLRKNNLDLLDSVSKSLWENYGMHQERGKETVARIVSMIAGHDVNHLAQVEKISHESRKRGRRGARSAAA
ncbi:MAG TPA: DinB family protein [Terriglobales bacterium]|nr:DinB family protein [Terriglobales bacterium]